MYAVPKVLILMHPSPVPWKSRFQLVLAIAGTADESKMELCTAFSSPSAVAFLVCKQFAGLHQPVKLVASNTVHSTLK